MRLLFLAFALLIFTEFNFTGCDSVTDSKPESITRPVLTAPPNNDSTVSTTPTFRWNNAGDKLEIDFNQGFSSPFHSAAVSGNEYIIPSGILQNNSTYYWRVGKSSGSTVYWCNTTFAFRTAP